MTDNASLPTGMIISAPQVSASVTEFDDVSTTSVAADQLRSIIERIERLDEERCEIVEQIKEAYAEAKANGFDTKTLRKVIAARKKALEERQEEQAMMDLYLQALGMVG